MAKRHANNKDMRQFIKALRDQGYDVTLNKSGHYRVRDEVNRLTGFLPATPGDHRSILNAKTQLRHRGFVVAKNH